jgi:hypothetical protein
MTNVDIWRSANLLIKQFGDQAELQAAMKADEMLERNDPAGISAWKNVIDAIRELKRDKPGGAEKRH